MRLQIANKLADAFDAAAICGSGTNGSPLGLLGIPGIGTTAIAANGGPATYDTILAMEEAVANGNAPDGIAWLSTPNVRKLLRKTFINSTGSEPVWEGDQVLGHPALVSTNVPSTLSKGTTSGSLHAIVCGAFSEIILCEFGSLEILVDRYRLKKQGAFELTAFWMVDVVVPRPAAFNVCIDAALS